MKLVIHEEDPCKGFGITVTTRVGERRWFMYQIVKAFCYTLVNSRAEISNLGETKRGWQKANASNKSSSALILSDERRDMEKFSNINQTQEKSNKKPKSPMELDRDLRNAKSVEDKIRYNSDFFKHGTRFKTASRIQLLSMSIGITVDKTCQQQKSLSLHIPIDFIVGTYSILA